MQPKPNISKLAPGVHGSIDYAELKRRGISPHDVIDFSVSTNPFGPSPEINEALSNISIARYPDSEAGELAEAISDKLGLSTDNVIIGSGSTELIRLVATAYFGPGDTVLVPQPTYAEYEVASTIAGAQILKQLMREKEQFQLDIAETANLIRKHQPKGIFLCNPNNPTGQYIAREEIEKIMSITQDNLIILDEAYIAFTRNGWTSLDLLSRGNLIILRSMTKDHSLAGLRLGYAVSTESIISILKRIKPPWNVSSVAHKAGVIALKSDSYLRECETKIQAAKNFLINELGQLGLSTLPSKTNFFLIKVGHAGEFRQVLLSKGILVRDCTSFGLPEYIRLAPRTLPECQRLITAIKESGVHSHAS